MKNPRSADLMDPGKLLPPLDNELERLRLQHQAVLRCTPHGLCMFGHNWTITWANHSLAYILAPENTERGLVGTNFKAFFDSDSTFRTYRGAALETIRAVGSDLRDVELRRADGSGVWCQVSLVRYDPTQTGIGYVGSITDITERRRHEEEIRLAYENTLEGWVCALDLRDKETEGHSQRVTSTTLRLARAAGISEDELIHIRRGALLHDVGKLAIPDGILQKPGPLSAAERELMELHPSYARDWLSAIPYLRPAVDIPYCHHEKWDGTGYPRRLKGEEIPLPARLFAVVDVWDALRSNRPYRVAWPEEKVREHIRQLSGTHFDPAAVQAFLSLTQTDEFPRLNPSPIF